MDAFEWALRLLPEELAAAYRRLDERERRAATELRLRAGTPPAVLLDRGERALGGVRPVNAADLRRVLENATAASPYAAADTLRQGYVTAKGGLRVGFCGEAVTEEGGIRALKLFTSAAVRLPREVRGCAAPFVRRPFPSTLIISPPGGGKTTLLRDMVRLLSGGGERVGLCDERGEIAACCGAAPGLDVGPRTDVITGGRKSETAMMLLRTMNPQILAMDEITAAADIDACEAVSNCGVALLATAHGSGVEDLRARRLYRALYERGVFRRAVVIRCRDGRRQYSEAPL